MQLNRIKSYVAASLLALAAGQAGAQIVTQTPLSAGGQVPGNLLLVPSVEWPTIDSQANIDANYVVATEYTGYFDPGKCYNYRYAAVETDRYFYPANTTSDHTCSASSKQWSGNFLNWAVTQTIDPFRKALTGGLRVIDTATLTVLEKARSDGNTGASIFNDRNLTGSGTMGGATPATGSWNSFKSRLRTFGNRMRFSDSGDLNNTPTAYDPGAVTLDSSNRGTVYEVSVRVKVCDPTMLEDNCVQYGSNYKPEGLIQKYANRMRYSAFGYLNDHDALRDGAALRARQKFVGPTYTDLSTGLTVTNANAEWSSADGTFIRNPDTTDAANTTTDVGAANPILDSGVINYVNKFGQMTTKNHKTYDPVSEMYYASIRYLRNLGNVPEYTDLSVGASTPAERYQLADGFPVISDWTDPYLYYCQKSAILGIGDVNTWNDKNLKGNSVTGTEPGLPSSIGSDTIDVPAWTQKVATIEGITIPTEFTGRNNSAYMVGLAYWAHTQDMRTETAMKGVQTVSTYWVDVREAQVLRDKNTNQYWLAAKYGGFTVPRNYDSNTATAALDVDWWYTNGEDLDPGAGVYRRADNFYVASQADAMIDSLTRAFARIAQDRVGSGASLASNSTRLDSTTRVYQAQFSSNYGQLQSYRILSGGLIDSSPEWSVGAPAGTAASPGVSLATRGGWSTRNIWTNAGGTQVQFRAANLTAAQLAQMTFAGMPTTGARRVQPTDIVDYLRGNDTREEDQTNGALRTRISPDTGWSPILGDIVDSTPIFVGAPSATLYSAANTFTGASSYAAFATAQASRLPTLWVGGNDGMLHEFDAGTGRELYAFVPNGSFIRGIAEYASPDYDHRYFIDGDMAVADVYDTANSVWRTILVGTMGRGGPGIFALDVTDPSSPTFLWEKGVAEIPRLGRNIGRPVIAQTADGVWKVLLGNGVDSTGGSARLVSINLFSGASSVATAGAGPANGLSAVLARDTDADGFADTAYAGDLKGHLFKFTGINGTPTVTTMITAQIGAVAQPITAAPFVLQDKSTGITWVYFGTGQYLGSGDVNTSATQSWYGVKDNGTVSTRANLVQRTVVTTATVAGRNTRIMSTGTVAEVATAQGWYFDMPVSKERMVLQNALISGAIIGVSIIPDATDICLPTGRSWLMALDPFTGGRVDRILFDTNRDGLFNSADQSGGNNISGTESGIITGILTIGTTSGGEILKQLGDGTMENENLSGSATDAGRLSWREVINQ